MSIDKKKVKKIIGVSAAVLGAAFGITAIVAKLKKGDSTYKNAPDQKNPMEGKKVVFVADENETENADGAKGHLEAVGETAHTQGFYEKCVKRGLDVILSFGGLVVLSPVYALISIAIFVDDPGPVLFTQKRVGQNKQYFTLHKFRSMKMSTPHDVPTHMLENPDQYITRVGRFLRKHSLDELPQIWDIFVGNMSVIGPRPALWNQDLLTAERDKYGANDVKPGLTGWAQINGRDELEIEDKARLDGEYCEKLGLVMDIKCFLGSLHVFRSDDSVVEGGTGERYKVASRHYSDGKTDAELIGNIGFGNTVQVDRDAHRKVLVAGAGSYIGESFRTYAAEHYGENFSIDALDMLDPAWKEADFSAYDIVYHVAGIAHADVGNVSDETKEKYYAVNTDLAIEVCQKAKEEGVKEFIFMSSMIVYGESAPYGTKRIVDEHTVPAPANFYGDSKLQADVGVRELAGDGFKVIVLRPPMIYGKGSKGNYPTLAKLAKKLPVFPNVDNERSMLYIENLCEFLCQIMLVDGNENAVVLIPQNGEWSRTSELVEEIAEISGKKIRKLGILNPAVTVGSKMPGKIGGLVNKAFGNMVYDQKVSRYDGIEYQKVDLRGSIRRTEGKTKKKPRALILASVASMIDQFNMDNINILLAQGYEVDVIANFKEPGNISVERAKDLKERLSIRDIIVHDVCIPRSLSQINDICVAYLTVEHICNERHYDIVHCHSPIGSVIARFAARKIRVDGCKVIYTAHGFHFYKGAPLKNWLIYYPVENICSYFTDVLITINTEDYELAKKKFHAKQVEYVPGVGVDIRKFGGIQVDRKNKRKEIGIPEDAELLLSVGELNENKNHETVIQTMAKMKEQNIYYIIVGTGDGRKQLVDLTNELGLMDRVKFLGFRDDVGELCEISDIYVFPSFREGLPVSLMEAMASGLPCAVSKIRGNTDLIDEEGGALFDPHSVDDCKTAIKKVLEADRKKMGVYNINKIKRFDIKRINKMMNEEYEKVVGGGTAI